MAYDRESRPAAAVTTYRLQTSDLQQLEIWLRGLPYNSLIHSLSYAKDLDLQAAIEGAKREPGMDWPDTLRATHNVELGRFIAYVVQHMIQSNSYPMPMDY